ncbi:MAG: adenylate/guanylate cyclase domain-containing protein [Burkholderiales bacterium]|nr:MAG: adenylate/guanylate cyclase domain-containing protein [Burkholderiales bacterium]
MALRDVFSMRARRLVLGLGTVVLAVACELGMVSLPLVDTLDRYLYDTRLRLQPARPNNRVLIVDIDERSLKEQGRWPWSRETLAKLTTTIAREGGARAIGFDMVFAEPHAQQDPPLMRALAGTPVALGYYFSSELGAVSTGMLPPSVFPSSVLQDRKLSVTTWNGYGANVVPLQRAARSAGFFNPVVDRDGVVRALPLLAEYKGQLYESLAVAMLRIYFGNAPLTLRADGLHADSLGFGPGGEHARVPISEGTTALVPFQGRGGASSSRFRYVSATDVLDGRIEPRLFRDRIVLIGTSAPGLTDLRATPVSEVYPGVEIHASLIAGALEGTIRTKPAEAQVIAAVAIAVVGGVAALSMAGAGVLGIAATTMVGLSTMFAWNAIAYANLGWVVPLAAGVLALIVVAAMNLVAGYVTEGRSRRAVIGLFGQYVAPQLVERMAHDPDNVPLESRNKELTILFADIRGFTRMAENMDPQQLRDYLNRFLTAMTEVIHAYNGTVDKYIGDAVMAFWGAPVDDPMHADHAVAAAIAMQREVARLNREFEANGWPPLVVGIGINTGVVRVGDMGSRLRRAYTVIGDAVNLASRLEGLSKKYDLPIVIGDATRRAVRAIALQYVAQSEVYGRTEPVKVWQPVPPDPMGYGGAVDSLSAASSVSASASVMEADTPSAAVPLPAARREPIA